MKVEGISVHHPEIGKPQHFLIRFADGNCVRYDVPDDYAGRMGANLVLGAIANINSRKENLT